LLRADGIAPERACWIREITDRIRAGPAIGRRVRRAGVSLDGVLLALAGEGMARAMVEASSRELATTSAATPADRDRPVPSP
jgi:hypothetical protein